MDGTRDHPPADAPGDDRAGGPGPQPRSWTLLMPGRDELPNSNDHRHMHWGSRSRWSKELRTAAKQIARAARLPRLDRARIACYVRMPKECRYDPGNFYPGAKAYVDGLIDYGLLPDDSARYLTGPLMYPGYPLRRGRGPVSLQYLEFVITELPPPLTLACRSTAAASLLAEQVRQWPREGEDDHVQESGAHLVIRTARPQWAERIRVHGAQAGLLAGSSGTAGTAA